MTFRHLVQKEYPELVSDEKFRGGVRGCPSDYNLEDRPDTCDKNCYACWNREVSKATIKDSGDRTKFDTGAVRDMRAGKGRMDLLPLEVVTNMLGKMSAGQATTTMYLNQFLQNQSEVQPLYWALENFCGMCYKSDVYTMLLEVAKHFEEGAIKYEPNNWKKGIPPHIYIDSALRHYMKWLRKDTDEPHDRAFVWNIMCCIWEVEFHKEAAE